MSTPLGVVINGLNGFAWVHHRAVFAAEQKALGQLLGYCDYRPGEDGEEVRRRYFLDQRGARKFTDLPSMLDELGARCGLVFIPSPPTVHAVDHHAAISRKTRCYLEKPPTLVPEELAGMIELERRVGTKAIVGFNQMADPVRFDLKRRLVAGDFGELKRIDLIGFWPRASAYYSRSRWPGKLKLDGQLALDSVFGNAMAHFLHGMLFWGAVHEVWQWSSVLSLRSELYRGNEIESPDTVFAKGTLDSGVEFRLAFSHACAETVEPIETLQFSDAVVSLERGSATVRWNNGTTDFIPADSRDSHDRSIERALTEVRGDPVAIPSVMLEHCVSFVELNALLYVAGGRIHSVAAANIRKSASSNSIEGVENAGRVFIETGKFPSAAGFGWGKDGGSAHRTDSEKLNLTIRTMTRSSVEDLK